MCKPCCCTICKPCCSWHLDPPSNYRWSSCLWYTKTVFSTRSKPVYDRGLRKDQESAPLYRLPTEQPVRERHLLPVKKESLYVSSWLGCTADDDIHKYLPIEWKASARNLQRAHTPSCHPEQATASRRIRFPFTCRGRILRLRASPCAQDDMSLHLCVGRSGSIVVTLVGRAMPGPYCRYIFPLVVTARWSLRSGRVKTLPYGGTVR